MQKFKVQFNLFKHLREKTPSLIIQNTGWLQNSLDSKLYLQARSLTRYPLKLTVAKGPEKTCPLMTLILITSLASKSMIQVELPTTH